MKKTKPKSLQISKKTNSIQLKKILETLIPRQKYTLKKYSKILYVKHHKSKGAFRQKLFTPPDFLS